MSEKLIVSLDEYNKTVEKLAVQIDESGYKPTILIGIISGLARHYFNLRGRNIHRLNILFTSIVALIFLAAIIFTFKN